MFLVREGLIRQRFCGPDQFISLCLFSKKLKTLFNHKLSNFGRGLRKVGIYLNRVLMFCEGIIIFTFGGGGRGGKCSHPFLNSNPKMGGPSKFVDICG
jgi:hypothetical protein